jgi:serine/threonine protein kinase
VNDPGAQGAELAPGDTLAQYRIEGVLGVGGMGRVYQATGPDGTSVALKVVKADLARDSVFRKRFDREARIAQSVVHPNLVPVLDAGEEGGVPYLTQRFIQGGSLAQQIEQRGQLDIEATVRACSEVSGALDALHANDLIHRDVKPANILVDEQGVCYITDFGLAKDTQGSLLTRPGQAVGSLDYMAPEQIRGEDVSAATDIYALGCVVQECLLGTPPFGGRPSMRVLFAHLQEPPPDISESRRDIPAAAARAINRALEKEPEDRPASASGYIQSIVKAAGI